MIVQSSGARASAVEARDTRRVGRTRDDFTAYDLDATRRALLILATDLGKSPAGLAVTGSLIDWPSKTIKAGVHGVSGGEAMIRFADGSLRYLTVREAARVQTFPDAYEFLGPRAV